MRFHIEWTGHQVRLYQGANYLGSYPPYYSHQGKLLICHQGIWLLFERPTPTPAAPPRHKYSWAFWPALAIVLAMPLWGLIATSILLGGHH